MCHDHRLTIVRPAIHFAMADLNTGVTASKIVGQDQRPFANHLIWLSISLERETYDDLVHAISKCFTQPFHPHVRNRHRYLYVIIVLFARVPVISLVTAKREVDNLISTCSSLCRHEVEEVEEVIERLESYRPSGLSWTPSAASALLALYRLWGSDYHTS